MEDVRLQELRRGRELGVQKEEIRHLKNLVAEQERTIQTLEEDIVQQNTVRERNGHTHTPKHRGHEESPHTHVYRTGKSNS